MEITPAYQKKASQCLIILWIGAIMFCLGMLYYWYKNDRSFLANGGLKNTQVFFVDQLLLSSKELELGNTVNLININLKADENLSSQTESTNYGIPDKKFVYSKIYEQKIKKFTSVKSETDGFTIKPIPQ